MQDNVNAFDRQLEAFGLPQIGYDKIRIEMANFAVIAGLPYHQPGMVSAIGELAGHLLANKTGSSGDQQFYFFVTVAHSPNSQIRIGVRHVVASFLQIASYCETYKLWMIQS
jgi:hypothetical protein